MNSLLNSVIKRCSIVFCEKFQFVRNNADLNNESRAELSLSDRIENSSTSIKSYELNVYRTGIVSNYDWTK